MLYGAMHNNPISRSDPLGLWPGYRKCVDAGERDVLDSSWAYDSYVPSGSVPAGGGGGYQLDSVTIRWTRGFKRKYRCCCEDIVWAGGKRGYIKEDTENSPFFFYGAAGPWTPIPTGANIWDWFVNVAGTLITWPSSPWPQTANDINGWIANHTPGPSELGAVITQPSTPWAWCWW